jgi:hypothetical protein
MTLFTAKAFLVGFFFAFGYELAHAMFHISWNWWAAFLHPAQGMKVFF